MLRFTLTALGGALKRCDFLRREDGTIAMETMIVLPLIFWAYLSTFSIFDAFRMYNLNQQATYTIGDAISRETVPINDDYLRGSQELFEFMTRGAGNTAIRVTSIWYDAAQDRYYTDWSKSRGWVLGLNSEDVKSWHAKLPVMPDKERVVLVETWRTYDPPFNTGLEERDIHNFIFTRPRYAPRVCWVDCNS
tara:strand:- start:25727 stop:26302 length:576 start_codon:yes stop_codon:yes gene_type:complete